MVSLWNEVKPDMSSLYTCYVSKYEALLFSVSVRRLAWIYQLKKLTYYKERELGWRSGESARLPPMWPGFGSRTRCHMWVESVVGSEGFSPGTPVFLPTQKPAFPNSNSTWKQWMEEPPRGIH